MTGASTGLAVQEFAATGTRGKPISIGILYQAVEAGSKQFHRALELLDLACESLSNARNASDSGDRIGCASEMLRFEQLLQPLFQCRSIGDGFANVINAIHMSLANLGGEPLNQPQVTTLWRIVRELAAGPFVSFGDSLEFVRQLDRVGLRMNNAFVSEWASELTSFGEEHGVR